jgi:uncharacterized protein
MIPARLMRLETHRLPGGLRLFVAHSRRARLLGLALLPRAPPAGWALVLPRCSSVHTVGMRFALDVVFLDAEGRVLRVARAVPPWRVVSCRGAAAAVEAPAAVDGLPAGALGALAAADGLPAAALEAPPDALEAPAAERGMIPVVADDRQRNRLAAALDPRQPIYRDTYNEYFMLFLSAGGAAAGTQVPLYILMAITGLWSLWVFIVACVVFELVVIFGLARPQMKPAERAGWAALWGATTAVLALCFYELVAKTTL